MESLKEQLGENTTEDDRVFVQNRGVIHHPKNKNDQRRDIDEELARRIYNIVKRSANKIWAGYLIVAENTRFYLFYKNVPGIKRNCSEILEQERFGKRNRLHSWAVEFIVAESFHNHGKSVRRAHSLTESSRKKENLSDYELDDIMNNTRDYSQRRE